jgi:hypothetical protein
MEHESQTSSAKRHIPFSLKLRANFVKLCVRLIVLLKPGSIQGCSTLQCHAAPGTAKPKVRAEGRFGTSPFALFAYFAVQSSLLRRPYPTVTPEPTAGKPPRQSARFSTANNAKDANGPATAQAPGEAFDLRTRVAGSVSLSLRSVNRER